MKKAIVLSLAVLSMGAGCVATARDIYTYKGSSVTPVKTVLGAKKLTFSSTKMFITQADGSSTDIALKDFDNIYLKAKPVPSAITKTVAGDTELACDGSKVTATGKQPVGSLEIFSANGTRVAAKQGRATTLSLSLDGLQAGTYVAKAKTGSQITTLKIVKK